MNMLRQTEKVVRFEVRNNLNETVWEHRSVDVAHRFAKSASRGGYLLPVTVVRVERIGNVTKERLVETF